MMVSESDFINILSASKIENSISIFVGAGLSSDAKMPDWIHLLKPCAVELGVEINEQTDLFKFAQYYANKFGYNKLRKIINQTLNTYQHESKLVSSILEVGFNSIWTTNFDKILENNLVKLNTYTNTIFDEKDLVNITWQNRVNIFKLNGDISNLDNIVITQEDLENYHKNHALFLTFLKKELITNTFIFVGYSFNDQIVLSALSEIVSYLGESSNTHYAIMKNKKTEEFNMFILDLEKRYHIQTVLVDEYDNIPPIFYKLKKKILDHNVFIAGSFESLSNQSNNFAYYLCKAIGEKLIENNYNVVTGFGRNIGYYISGAITQKIINNNLGSVEQRLILRPFAHIMSPSEDTQFRKLLISNANTSIFLYGQHLNNGKEENSRGAWEEFLISKEMNKNIIPIGVTGYTAKDILQEIKKNISCYSYLKKYISILEYETNIETLSNIVICILKDLNNH